MRARFVSLVTASSLLLLSTIASAECQSTSVSSSSKLNGNLSPEDCRVSDLLASPDNSFVDVYELVVVGNGTVIIAMDSTEFDPFLRLLNTDKATIVQDDDSGTGFNAKIESNFDAGTYLLLANSATSNTDTGSYELNITLPAAAATQGSARLSNIATRAFVDTGDGVTIGGLIIAGSEPKTVVIRAIGPDLANRGVEGALLDPNIQLFSGPDLIDSNDDWDSHARKAEIPANLVPQFQLESAIVATLEPGPYTAIVRGNNEATGVGLVEIFEVAESDSKLINIATRGLVGTGDNVMIGGLIISGDTPQTVLVRAVGPSLTSKGVPNALQDPILQIFSGPNLVEMNNNWQDHSRASEIVANLQPEAAAESAILITLEPGAYTAIVSGAGSTTGIGLVEVFEID